MTTIHILDTREEIENLPIGSIILVGVDNSDEIGADPAPLQKGFNGKWLACGIEKDIDLADLRDESLPAHVLHVGQYPEPPASSLDEFFALLDRLAAAQ